MVLSDEMREALKRAAITAYAEQWAAALESDDERPEASVKALIKMLFELNVNFLESGHLDELFSIVWQNGHDSGEEFGMSWSYWAEHNGGAEPVREENPYAV